MNIKHANSMVPARALPRRSRLFIIPRSKVLAFHASVLGTFAIVASGGQALAQGAGGATPSTGGIGAQIATMSQEGTTAGGYIGSMAMYVCALICLLSGAWALWMSRQPQNRQGGHVGMGLAGLVLCGLFAAGGTWINKAANTTSGGNANITATAGTVTFGGAG